MMVALGKAYASRSCMCAGACWRAKCHRCGEVVSKHDFDAAGAWAALEQHDEQTHPRSPERTSTDG